MAEQMTMEQQASAIDAAEAGAGENGSEQNAGSQSSQQQQPANTGFDPAEFRAFMAEYRQHQNQINSQLGNFSKKQSELDKFLAAQNKPQAPADWTKLDDQTRKATRAIIRAAWEEEFGDKAKAWDGVHESWQQQEQNNRIMSIANQALGVDYGKYDQTLGALYLQVKQSAESGDQNAARFLKEIRETDSGVRMLVEMAKQQVAQSMQGQSEKAKLEQEGKAKRAATGVGGGRPQTGGSRGDGLPADKAERMAEMRRRIDEANSQG